MNLLGVTWATGTSLVLSAPSKDEQERWMCAISLEIKAKSEGENSIPFGLMTSPEGKVGSGGGSRPFEEAEGGGEFEFNHTDAISNASSAKREPMKRRLSKGTMAFVANRARKLTEGAREQAKAHVQAEAQKRAQKQKEDKEWERITMIRETGGLNKTTSALHMVQTFKGHERRIEHMDGKETMSHDEPGTGSQSEHGNADPLDGVADVTAVDDVDTDAHSPEAGPGESTAAWYERKQMQRRQHMEKHKVLLQGWLQHKPASGDTHAIGGLFRNHWRRRFVVLSGHVLKVREQTRVHA
jgi:hypothetical protein